MEIEPVTYRSAVKYSIDGARPAALVKWPFNQV